MTVGKGTQARGKRHTKVHVDCRRCGRKTYHIQNKRCSHCGFPRAKMRSYGWALKTTQRQGQGFGRTKHLQEVARRAKNNFRFGTVAKSKPRTA